MRFPTVYLFSAILSLPVMAEPPTAADQAAPADSGPETAKKETKPMVKKISGDTYQIGKITFNKSTREIHLDTMTNIVDPGTPLEFLLCHSNGEKVHESLLVTEADPTHLNIALKLLNYKESQELFRQLKPDHTLEDHYPVVADTIRKAARFTVHLTWKAEGKEKTAPITQWLQHRITEKPMPATPWVYNGSYVWEGKFKAKLNGNILAIFPNESALANYPGADREDDTLWLPAERLPREGSKVTVILKPWDGKLSPQETKVK
ncbi:hypothetical protein HW115_16150 [Verrucomicrobiaceae bacterium N1E253]|uniref:Uncharacterized protein n=1 Tax=Oceaniferula marina TaxID=2748318 RepID=A0A851GPW1_9BACT|nr:YdjY domain-containing protein [Oceaniferula marina]NWK57155.1 hypothetical protein [Oceaniferula marina]